MDVIGIPNAPWWNNNSTVVVKEDYLAQDEAWVLNQVVALSSDDMQDIQTKHIDILKVRRMVQPGSVVAVNRANGRVKTVQLPQDASQLLWNDVEYILKEINRLNVPVMTPDEQKTF